MKSIILVFVITVLFLIGMTKFTNDTNYNETIRYAELSQFYNEGGEIENDNVFLETIKMEVSFSGAVNSTNKVEISYVSYLTKAIELIGGLKVDADTICIDNNFVILQNHQFYIPYGINEEKVSINKADEEELMTLTSIGGITAKRIIEYRELNGSFNYLEQIMEVNGIGTITFEKIKDYIILWIINF